VVRFFILQSHYRSTLDFSAEALEAAGKGMDKLLTTIRNVQQAAAAGTTGDPTGIDLEQYRTNFLNAMNDDFNTPLAIAGLFDLSRELNQAFARGSAVDAAEMEAIAAFFGQHAGAVLGLSAGTADNAPASKTVEPELLELFISLRAELRREKLWGLSDRIRDGLVALGIVLEDKKEGTTWKRTPAKP
jgi:cysteinyl-tRNA synthetase